MGIDWKKLLGGVAPAIATALGVGGSPAGIALSMASRALFGRSDAKADDLAAALAAGASPDQLAKLADAEHEFAMKLVDSAVALEKLENEDRASARQREIETHDWTPRLIGLVIVCAFLIMLGLLVTRSIPAENEKPFDIVLGILSGAVTTVLTYYFGTSASSRAKDVVLGRIAGK